MSFASVFDLPNSSIFHAYPVDTQRSTYRWSPWRNLPPTGRRSRWAAQWAGALISFIVLGCNLEGDITGDLQSAWGADQEIIHVNSGKAEFGRSFSAPTESVEIFDQTNDIISLPRCWWPENVSPVLKHSFLWGQSDASWIVPHWRLNSGIPRERPRHNAKVCGIPNIIGGGLTPVFDLASYGNCTGIGTTLVDCQGCTDRLCKNISPQLYFSGLDLKTSYIDKPESNSCEQDGREGGDHRIVNINKSLCASGISADDGDGIILVAAILGSALAGFLTYAGLKGR